MRVPAPRDLLAWWDRHPRRGLGELDRQLRSSLFRECGVCSVDLLCFVYVGCDGSDVLGEIFLLVEGVLIIRILTF